MKLCSIAFAGFRAFPPRGIGEIDAPLQRLELAPLTLVFGKNNAGKSSLLRLFRLTLAGLAYEGPGPLPPGETGGRSSGRFKELLHRQDHLSLFDLEVELADASERAKLSLQLYQAHALDDDAPPQVYSRSMNGIKETRAAVQRTGDGLRGSSRVEAQGKGLLPSTPDAQKWRDSARQLREQSIALGPTRGTCARSYARPGVPPKLSGDGSGAAELLAAEPVLAEAVGTWFEKALDWRLRVRTLLEDFYLELTRGENSVNLVDAGEGSQQVLPVVTLLKMRALARNKHQFLDFVEQPELHLHDAVHPELGDLLLDASKATGGTFVVETHSEGLLLRVRRRIAEGLPPAAVALYFVDSNSEGSQVKRVRIAEDGEVDYWPAGVFSERFEEVKAIRSAQRNRRSSGK